MLLALDTATATASLAVYNLTAGQLLAEYTWQARRRQTQDLLATAQAVLGQLDLSPAQLTALAVTTGPGSFTGVRIAISAIKGIGLGLPVSPLVIGLPTLCVTAAPWLQTAGATTPVTFVCAYIQAGRGRYNWAFFEPGDELRRPRADEHGAGGAAGFAAALAALAPRPIWVAGEADGELAGALTGMAHISLLEPVGALRRAGQLARLAACHLAQGSRDDLAALQPLYLRSP